MHKCIRGVLTSHRSCYICSEYLHLSSSSCSQAMRRARLRSREACRTCKCRRKKCDEVRPVCGSCQRLCLRCDWIGSTNRTVASHRHTQSMSCPVSPLRRLLTSKPNFTSDLEYDLLCRWPSCYTAIAIPGALLDHTHLSVFVTVAIQEASIRSALVTFSAYTLFIQGEAQFTPIFILKAYQKSVQQLLLALYNSHLAIDSVALVISATMLGMIEVSDVFASLVSHAYGQFCSLLQ